MNEELGIKIIIGTIIFIATLLVYYIFVLIRICLKAIFKPNKKYSSKKILTPIWEKSQNERGELIYKFSGFSEFDSKSKFLEIEKIQLLNSYEKDCYQKILENSKVSKSIIALAKLPLKQYITITDENKLAKGWRGKMEQIVIDFTILDYNYNPIAAIQFKRYTEEDKLIEDVFFNIRVPVFWIDKNKQNYEKQIPEVFQRLSSYFEQAGLINNK